MSTQNVLSQEVETSQKTRYSQTELAEFKKIIEGKISECTAEIKDYQKQIIANTEDMSQLGREDRRSLDGEQEYLKGTQDRAKTFLNQLGQALVRIKNGTYGVCKTSGKLISKERLRIVPHATECINIKKQKRKEY